MGDTSTFHWSVMPEEPAWSVARKTHFSQERKLLAAEAAVTLVPAECLSHPPVSHTSHRYIPAIVDHTGGLPCQGTFLLHQVPSTADSSKCHPCSREGTCLGPASAAPQLGSDTLGSQSVLGSGLWGHCLAPRVLLFLFYQWASHPWKIKAFGTRFVPSVLSSISKDTERSCGLHCHLLSHCLWLWHIIHEKTLSQCILNASYNP